MRKKRKKQFYLQEGAIELIEQIAAREGIPESRVIEKASWYYSTLDDRLAEAVAKSIAKPDSEFMQIVAAMIAAQNIDITGIIADHEKRAWGILDRIEKKLNGINH